VANGDTKIAEGGDDDNDADDDADEDDDHDGDGAGAKCRCACGDRDGVGARSRLLGCGIFVRQNSGIGGFDAGTSVRPILLG
jgi:hypothetical protein